MVMPYIIQQNRNIMCMPVLIQKNRVDCQQLTQIHSKFFQPGHSDRLFYQKPHTLLIFPDRVNSSVQALTIHTLKQPLQCDQLPSSRQKIPAFAAQIPVMTIDDLFRLIRYIFLPTQTAVCKQSGYDILGQTLISGIISLIPDSLLLPFQLIPLGGLPAFHLLMLSKKLNHSIPQSIPCIFTCFFPVTSQSEARNHPPPFFPASSR